ncbi:hypothetical protein GCM10022600_15210 [Qipengyuania pelagi]|uniref:HIRAN domain-containing protein n=1 Tax=Qipengyuania pelagi TaxID=994320 RepID=A0A844Y632_9SPHN|nr:hypothetical protein [Qipengyuania pelagi]
MGKRYSVGIVGESSYQPAIAELREGEHVSLIHEDQNPYDPRAIAVKDGEDRTIGYIPRDHWLTEALLDQGRMVRARVERIEGGDTGRPSRGVVLDVELATGEDEAAETAPPPATGKVFGAAEAARRAAERAAGDRAEGGTPANGKLKKGCLWAIGIFVGLAALGALLPDTPESEDGGTEATTSSAADDDGTGSAAAGAWRDTVMVAMEPCDNAIGGLGETLQGVGSGSATMLDGYQQAQTANRVCEGAWSRLQDLDPPPALEGEAEDRADDALEQCQIAMMLKGDAAEQAMAFLDGDARPSVISGIGEKTESAGQATMACVAGLISVAGPAAE